MSPTTESPAAVIACVRCPPGPYRDSTAWSIADTFNDLAKLVGSLIFLIGLPGLYAFQATRAGRLGLAGFALSFVGLAILEVSTEAMFAFVGPVLAAHNETRFLLQGGLEQNLGGGFLAYFTLSYLVVLAGFVSFGIATFRARVYPRWAGPVIAIGSVAAIVMAPLAPVPSGPVRLDRVGVLAASFAFVWCGWHLLRHATLPGSNRANDSGGGCDRPGSRPDHDR
jgi:hypothetical protein